MNCKVLWLTGLSGAGKSTIALGAYEKFLENKFKVIILDGDYIRNTLHKSLKFTPEDIIQNNRKTAYLCKSIMDQYHYIFVPIISPFKKSRENAKNIIGPNFVEVYIKAKLETVIKRDTKGMYKKAEKEKFNNLIGIDPNVPYEHPEHPNLVLDTDKQTKEKSVEALLKYLKIVT